MTATTQQLERRRQKIVTALRVLLTDPEDMLRPAADVPDAGVEALRERIGAHVASLPGGGCQYGAGR